MSNRTNKHTQRRATRRLRIGRKRGWLIDNLNATLEH